MNATDDIFLNGVDEGLVSSNSCQFETLSGYQAVDDRRSLKVHAEGVLS